MKRFADIMLKLSGWKVVTTFPDLQKSVIIFAPHTSYWDGFYGKLFFMQLNIPYKFLSKKEFFRFPLNLFFKLYGSIPVSRTKEYVDEVVAYLDNSESLHIVLSPEGHMARTDHWKKGFYYMAKKANVPIVVGAMDYKKKELSIKGVIYDISDINETFLAIGKLYQGVGAKYPEKFVLDKRYN
ncbi:MAG: 1-acyl-sn-glycerol-3-phosphate acyltransferase [Prolixibacteraceae bacterium]